MLRKKRIYILWHPACDYILRARFAAALACGVPGSLDFADMMQRRATGSSVLASCGRRPAVLFF